MEQATSEAVTPKDFSTVAFRRIESSAGFGICSEDEGRRESVHASAAKA